MGEWKTSWSYLLVDYGTGIGTVENVTQRTVFWNNLSGNKVRLKLSNIYGTKPLLFEKVVIAKKDQKEEKIIEFTTVKKDNSEQICIEPGMEFYSDEIDGQVELAQILVSVFNTMFSNVEFRKIEINKYKLSQAADLICTVESIAQKNVLTKSEKEFFHSKNEFKKNIYKNIVKKKL